MADEHLFHQIPTGWETTTLGAIVRRGGGNIQTGPFGSQLHASDYVPVGVPSIMPVNIGENRIIETGISRITEADANRLAKHRVQAGDIIYSRRGDVELRALIRKEQEGWFCGTGCLKVRLGSGVADPLFASFYLGHPAVRAWIVQHAVGATMPNLNTGIMETIPFVLPPLIEQQAIACILGALDDKIELNRRRNRTLESMARAIFQSWFVEFNPVRAKAAGQAPPGLTSEFAARFPDSFTDSPLGPIPKGWCFEPLGSLVDLQRGKTYKSSQKDLPGPVLLGLASIERNGGFRDDKLSTYGGDSPRNLILTPGDLFASLKDVTQSADLLGAVARVPPHIERGRLTQDTVKLIFKTEKCSRQLVYRTLLTANYRDYCRSHATGTTNLGLSRDDFLAYPILQPCDLIQRAFDKQIEVIDQAANMAIGQSRTLAALRDTLLPKLISGELRVPDAERIVGRAI